MIAQNREDGGKLVRDAWISWAQRQEQPKPSWLVSWENLSESDKEADRCIWDEIVAPYTTVIAELHIRIAILERDVTRLEEDNRDSYGDYMELTEMRSND